jgi:hypothetical protein
MHHAAVVVGHAVRVDGARCVLLEVVVHAGVDVPAIHGDVLVPVRSRLLVLKSDGMTNFMDSNPFLENMKLKAS